MSGGTRKPIPRTGVSEAGDHPYDPEISRLLPLYDIGGRPYFGYRMVLAARLFDRRIIEVLEATGGLTLPQWRVLAQLGLTANRNGSLHGGRRGGGPRRGEPRDA